MKGNKEEKLRDWFLVRPALKLTILEQEANLPTRTLQRFMDGRSLPEKHYESLISILKKYGHK